MWQQASADLLLSVANARRANVVALEPATVDSVRRVQGAPGSYQVAIGERAEGSAEAQRRSKAVAALGPEPGCAQISSISCGERLCC